MLLAVYDAWELMWVSQWVSDSCIRDFADVTLVCEDTDEDDEVIKSDRLRRFACGEFFLDALLSGPHAPQKISLDFYIIDSQTA